MKGKRQRQLHPLEAYTILHYNKEGNDLKAKTLQKFAEYEASLGDDEPTMGLNAFRNKYLREELRKEPLVVQQEVKAYCEKTGKSGYDEKDEFPDLPKELAIKNGKALAARK